MQNMELEDSESHTTSVENTNLIRQDALPAFLQFFVQLLVSTGLSPEAFS